MKSIKSVVENEYIFEDILLESVFERHMQMIINQFKKYDLEPSKSIKEFFKILGISADIDASKIEVYDYIDNDAKKDIDSALKDDDKIVIGLMQNPATKEIQVAGLYMAKYENNRSISEWQFLPTKTGHKFGYWECINQNPLSRYKENSKKNRIKTFEHCCEVWVISRKGIDVANLQKERSNSRYGMWENTPEFYAKVAKSNIDRYKQQLTKMRIEKNSEFENVVKEADDLVQKMYTVFMDMSKNMEKGKWGRNINLSNLAMNLNDKCSYILRYMQNLMRQQKDWTEAKERDEKWAKEHPEQANKMRDEDFFSSGYYLRSYRRDLDDTKEEIAKAKEIYKKLIDGIKDFNSN